MKGYIQDQSIVLVEALPEELANGDAVEITIQAVKKPDFPFPTFNLGVKQAFLDRDKLYGHDPNLS
jgi:hypothetical protein